MARGKRAKRTNSILRLLFVGVSLLLQVGWLLLLVFRLNAYSATIAFLTGLLSTVVVLKLYSKNANSTYKTPWILLIMAFPVMGLCLYLLVDRASAPRLIRKRLGRIRKELDSHFSQEPEALAELEARDLSAANQCRYLKDCAASPLYRNTQAVYYADAADAFEALKAAVEQAQNFIFLEYFIVEDGEAFRQLREILVRKAAQGVEVRLMYDDVGSVGYANMKFARSLTRDGIRCQVFNPVVPVLNLFMNHRDHRKIAVIDGRVGFTGGYNIANEYFGLVHPYGQWKDMGIRLEGEAVRRLTATFLELWAVSSRQREDYSPYLAPVHSLPQAQGFVQPFGDDPTTDERVAENVYLNLISRAEKRLWFMTPYLIITDEMSRALGLAAKRGVDVRIITPGIPDKKTVFQLTRSYYAGLARQGVRIFEYTPGFCHGKLCLCDGDMASIGTSNLDYRSLYLHFENNVLLCDCPAIQDMRSDLEKIFEVCREMTEKYRSGRSGGLRIWQCILRLFAPLM